MTWIKTITACSALLLLCSPPAGAAGGDPIVAVTIPSADRTLSFTQPGIVAKVQVKLGDQVRQDQVLVQQDDAIERAQLAQLQAQSNNTSQLQASEASYEQKQVDLQKIERAAARGAATELELQHAQLEVKMAKLSVEIAKLQHQLDKMRAAEAEISVARMQIKSPISGSIEQVDVEPGESINALEGVVRVVRIDPLWTDVPVPLAIARTLTAGRKASVTFSGSEKTVGEGQVIFVAAVADAASDTLLVRVEVPNAARRPAGENVRISFAAP